MSFGQRLRRLRKKKGLTQGSLSDKFNISESAVGMYERGEREPSLEQITKFADFFGVSVDYITGRSEDETGNNHGNNSDPLDDPTLNLHFKDWDKLSPERQEEVKAFIRAQLLLQEAEERNK